MRLLNTFYLVTNNDWGLLAWQLTFCQEQEQTLGEHGFFYSGPAACRTLPSDLHNITDTSTFRKRLEGVLFDRVYNW